MTPPASVRVVVAGSVTIDANIVSGRRRFKLGGVPVYAGLAYAREGLAATVVANTAPQDGVLFEPLASQGLAVRLGHSKHTTRFVNRTDGDRRTQRVPVVARAVAWCELHAALPGAAWVHLGPLHPDDIEVDVYERLDRQRPVVLDLQGLVRRVRGGRVEPFPSALLPRALEGAAIVKSSEDEREIVLNALGGPLAQILQQYGIGEWLTTGGARGGCVHVRGGPAVSYIPEPAEPIDPTGAGDVFLAAYAAARLARKSPPDTAARHASAAAARQISGRHIPFELLSVPGRTLRVQGFNRSRGR
jgi:sugar/nucleoside kinase (ribokinase family)